MRYELVKHRDAGMHTFTYFWVDTDNDRKVVSPYFDTLEEAEAWGNGDLWKPSREFY